MASIKLQATLTGHTGWAVSKLAVRRGKTQAEIASHLLDVFFEENPEYLKEHGITYDEFELEERGARVFPLERSSDPVNGSGGRGGS